MFDLGSGLASKPENQLIW